MRLVLVTRHMVDGSFDFEEYTPTDNRSAASIADELTDNPNIRYLKVVVMNVEDLYEFKSEHAAAGE